MVAPVKKIYDEVSEFYFDFSVLENKKLDVCLIQAPAPDFELVENDKSRQTTVKVVSQLLAENERHGQPVLKEILPRSKMTLILLPEFAFGYVDWDELDTAIRESRTPIMLIAGFGATAGALLTDWVKKDGETKRHWAWSEDISNIKVVNGAWCWIHQPNIRTDCIVWMKNIAEQRVEAVNIPNMQFGKEVLHIKFNDLSLLPVICADLLNSVSVPGSTQEKLRKAIDLDQRPTVPVLITGSLWQTGYNRNWENAVGNILQHVVTERPSALALCNIAHDIPLQVEEADKWRSMSGVFTKFQDLPKSQKHLPAGRALDTSSISGVVIRDSKPCIVGGKLGWRPFNPVEGQFLWHSDMLCHIDSQGIDLMNYAKNTIIRCEVGRNLRRLPNQKNWDPCVNIGLKSLRTRAEGFSERTLKRLVSHILSGLQRKFLAEPDDLHENESYRDGIYAIAALKSLENAEWLTEDNQDGHLVSSGAVNLLVWSERERGHRFVRSQVEKWLQEPEWHPKLIVFGRGGGGEGEIHVSSRTDISTPSGAITGLDDDFMGAGGSITESKIIRRAAIYSIDKVSAMYMDFVADEAVNRANELQDVIRNAFVGGR